jgi:DNA ligase 1
VITKFFPTLYKRSSTGKIQTWKIAAIHNNDSTATIRVIHGQQGGKQQSTETEIKAGKNVGRANETNAWGQAISEAQSKWNKQLDKGYTETEGGKSLETKPMLAHSYDKYKEQVVFPACVQEKLDGIRCIAIKHPKRVELLSRMGKPITTMTHIEDQLMSFMREDEILDGELYVHGVPFQKITSWVKRKQENSILIKYHVYDTIHEGRFPDRFKDVDGYIQALELDNVVSVSYWHVKNHDEIKKLHDQFVESGYEGLMLRHNGCPYKAGYRSRDLLKVKDFMDEEFAISGVSQGKGKFKGMAVFTCVTKDGEKFDCMPKGDEELRRQYWTNRKEYIGKTLTVRFFEWTTGENPVPRFPVGIVVRDYEG